MSWQNFEEQAQKYLKENLKVKSLDIIFNGGSDSNLGDVELIKNKKHLFNIEIKEYQSQIGQFVVLPKHQDKKFILGNLKFNTNRISKIYEHMNENYEYYKSPTTAGINLKCSKKMMYESIYSYCKDHNIEFFISKRKTSNFKIISIQNFEKNFDISGKYRKKKSGTSYIKNNDALKDHLKKLFPEGNINSDKKGLILKLKNSESLKLKLKKNRSYQFDNINIYFSPINDNEFYVKKKSCNNNATVIFSLEFHNKNKDDDLNMLKNRILNS